MKLKNIFIIGLTMLLLFTVSSCSKDDEALLTNKWQLRENIYDDGNIEKIDSVFYNFQKGSFSAICLYKDGNYYNYFGLYTIADKELSINIEEPENPVGEAYEKYLGWENKRRVYTIEKITSNKLELRWNNTVSVFRKY